MEAHRAIIIDDEQKGIESLLILIKQFTPEISVVAYTTKPQKAVGLIESYRPEIVFLDINMPVLNGFELLDNLSWRNFDLIFTTAHQEHALRALKINAFDYLLKPVDYEELQATVKRILTKSRKGEQVRTNYNFASLIGSLEQVQKGGKVLITSKTGMEPIDSNDIICMESRSNYTKIMLINERMITTTKSLKDYEAELCYNPSSFMRVHHSFIVNLDKISRFIRGTSEIVMVTGQKIPLANSKKDRFMLWLNP